MPQKPLFNVGPTTKNKGIARPSDESIRTQQKANLSPIQNRLVDSFDWLMDQAEDLYKGVTYDPTNSNAETLGLLGKLTALGLAAPAVAYGGGRYLPRLKQISENNLRKLDLDQMPDWFPDWATYMMEKYPRVMAHQEIKEGIPSLWNPKTTLGSNSPRKYDPETKLSTIRFNRREATPSVAMHEVTHGLQRITEPGFADKYAKSIKDSGYYNSPYEVQARATEVPRANKFNEWRKKYNPQVAVPNKLEEQELLTPRYLELDNRNINKFNNVFDIDPETRKIYTKSPETFASEDDWRNLQLAADAFTPSITKFEFPKKPIQFPSKK